MHRHGASSGLVAVLELICCHQGREIEPLLVVRIVESLQVPVGGRRALAVRGIAWLQGAGPAGCGEERNADISGVLEMLDAGESMKQRSSTEVGVSRSGGFANAESTGSQELMRVSIMLM